MILRKYGGMITARFKSTFAASTYFMKGKMKKMKVKLFAMLDML